MPEDASGPLASLLSAPGAERFLLRHWPHAEFFAHCDRSAWPEFLRSDAWSDLARIQQLYTGPVQVTRDFVVQSAGPGARLQSWVGVLGMACLLQDLHTSLPGAAAWLAALERELGVPPGCARLSAFVNPPGVGLGVHCDPREHLLIQLAGRKRIRTLASPAGLHVAASHSASGTLAPAEAAQYAKGLPAWTRLPDEAVEYLLEPGSVLWMPRGTYHETRAEGAAISTSLVVQLDLPSCADALLAYLRRYLAQDERWRTPLAACGEAGPEPLLRSLLGELGQRLPRLQMRPLLAGSVPASAPAIDPADRFVRNPSVLVSVRTEAHGAACLQIARACGQGRSERIALGAAGIELVQALSAIAEPIAFAEVAARFADWDERSLASIAAFLVRQEIWIPLSVEAYRA